MTTPVGSIRLDLIIDGSKVDDAAINEAVRRRMAGVLGETEQGVRRVEQAHTDAGRAAEKSAATQVAAEKTVERAAERTERAVDDIGEAHTKTALKAEASAARSTRSINAETRAIERQAAAWTKLAAAQTAAAAAPTPNGGSRSGPPPNRGGGGRGGGSGAFGDLFTGQGGGSRFLTSPVGLNSLALGASALPAATLAVTNLAGAVQQFAQGGLLIPGVVGGIVASVSTLKIGLSGVEDGFKAAWKAAGDGASAKDIKKATDQMKGLSDSAKSTIAAAVGLRPQIEHLQKDIAQQNLFDGLDNTVTTLANKVMPTAEKGLGGISKAWNSTLKTLGSALGSDSSISLMDRIFGNTAEGQNRLNKAIDPAVHAVETLVAKGTDFLPRLADGMTAGLTRLDNWVTRSEQNGNLDKWINQGIDAAGHLGESLLSVGKIITSITQAAGGDGGLLKLLDTGSTKLADFLNSADGQQKLTTFFSEARKDLGEWLPILGNVANVAGDVFRGFQQWGDTIRPVVASVTDALSGMGPILGDVVTGFLAFKTFSGLASLLGSITTLGGLLDGLGGKASNAGKGVVDGINPATVAITAALTGLNELNDRVSPQLKNAKLPDVAPPGLPWYEQAWNIFQSWIPGSQFQPPGPNPISLGGGPNAQRQRRGMAPIVTQIPQTTPFDPNPLPIAGLQQPAPAMPSQTPGELQQIAGAAQNANTQVGQLNQSLTSIPVPPPIPIKVATEGALADVRAFAAKAGSITVTLPVRIAPTTGSAPTSGGSAAGAFAGRGFGHAAGGITRMAHGVLPGYSPGVDNLLGRIGNRVFGLSGGEGILIPEAVRGLGGAPGIYAINSLFRRGLSRAGYSGGGVTGFDGGGVLPDGSGSSFAGALAPVIGLLTQIRDVLGGGGGGGRASSSTVLGALSDTTSTGGLTGTGTGATPGGILGSVDLQRITANLSAFAHSGNLADVSGIGLDANDPVITALVSARNKKKGGLSDDQIGDLVGQVLGGGYTGVLDSSNSSLVKSLTSFRDKVGKAGGAGGADLTSARGIAAAFPDDIGKRFLANFLSQAGADAQFIGDALGTPLYAPTGKSASTSKLLKEGNFLGAAGGLAGYEVPDFTRQGGAPGTQTTMATNAPAFNASGQIGSDVAGIVDRTMTSFKASFDAKFDQMTAILTQMRDQLASIAGKLVNSAISSGASGAGQIIQGAAQAPGAGGAPGGFFDLEGTAGFGPFLSTRTQIGGLFDEGGLWPSGTFGTNLSGSDERVLDPNQTRLFDRGLLGGWNIQPQQQHMASVDGLDVTDKVGADFFGLGRVPIIGTILNLLVSILLKTLGIHIEARNTLTDLTQQVRQFRGDFKSFNSTGLIAGDSSGLISRNASSKDLVNKERVRILTEVLVGVVKYLIEKIIVPLINTLVQSAIQLGQSAISGAVNAGVSAIAPGAGGIAGGIAGAVSGVFGNVANTLAQVASEFLGTLATNAVAEIIPALLGALPTALFGLFNIPGVFSKLFGGVGAVLASVAGVFGGLFDEGGVANGIGMMPKNTVKPERVLSPSQTASFERLVDILDASGITGGSSTAIDAKIYVEGGPTAPTAIRDEIVALAGT